MRRALLVAGLLALLAPAAATARDRTVRVFAVQPKFDLSWVDSRAHFAAKLRALADRGIVPHRSGRELVTLPEDLGLMAAFTGSRGATARQAPDLTTAILRLVAAYQPVSAAYAMRFASLTTRALPTRLLAVSLTDTFGRTLVEPAAALARRLHATVVVGAIMPQRWRIVCADRSRFRPPPGATRCDREDPARVAALRSPDEPTRDYAYEATTPKASTVALVFGPGGRRLATVVKTYLTPVELPGALDLVPGRVTGGGRVVDTPAGRLGIVTSKDAWMPDVTAKLDEAHADLLVQPEFFVGDTLRRDGTWAADTIAASGYADLLRHPSLQALALPSLTGNVLDFSADNQAAVAVKPRAPDRGARRLAGGLGMPGLLAVAPTAIRDRTSDGILQRRRRLGAAGEAQVPGGPPCPHGRTTGACRGGQVEAVVWHDVTLRHPPVRAVAPQAHGRAPFSVNRPLTAAARGAQRNVSLAARGRHLLAAFEERRGGTDHVLTTVSRDAGRTWAALHDLGPGQWPSAALGAGGAYVAFQRRGHGVPRVLVVRGAGRPRAVGGPPGAAQWRPSVAATGRTAYVAWIDERERFTGAGADPLPRAVVYGTRLGGTPRPVDPSGPAAADAATLDHDWAPSVAARDDRVAVAWTDFRSYDWRIRAAESADGGRSFAAPRGRETTPRRLEALDDTPRAAYAGSRLRVAWTRYARSEDPLPNPLYDVVVDGRQVDGDGRAQVDAFAPALAPPFVAWQDHPRGAAVVRVRRLGGRVHRVQDAGARGNAWRPALVRAGGRLVVAWEDARGGAPRIYVAGASAGAV